MNETLQQPEQQKLAADNPVDQRVNLAFRVIMDAGFNSGCTYRVLFRSLRQKNSLLQRLMTLTNIGLIASDGGLISNLSVQENILLPVQYHAKTSDKLALKNVTSILMRFGLSQSEIMRILRSSPSNLSLLERRLVSFVRIMVVESGILVCDTVFEGMAEDEILIISRFNEIFHLYFPLRTVIFLELDHTRGIISADKTFYLQ